MRFPAFSAVRAFIALTLLVNACGVGATANQERQRANIQTELEEFFKTNGRGWTVRLSSDGRRVTSLVGRRTKPYQGDPLQKATQFLKENARLVGFDFRLDDFKVGTSRVTNFGANLELQQIFKQLRVENGRIQINFDKEGHVVQFVSSVTPTVGALDSVNITKNRAIQIGIEQFLRTTLVYYSKTDEQRRRRGTSENQSRLRLNMPPSVENVFFASNERLRTAYKIRINAANPFGIKEFIIDANNGGVLQTRDFVAGNVDGSGQVFIPNPVNSLNDSTIREYNFPPFHNPNPYYTRPLLGLTNVGGSVILEGPFVVLRDIQPPANTQPTPSTGFDFIFERDNTSFQEVMVYYHITVNQLYVQSLGLGQILNRSIWADAHACFGYDKSQYVGEPTPPLPKHILYGDGGVDDAEDGDVIIHEYAHALQDDQAPGKFSGSGYPQAMREGFGDYWAFSSFDEDTVNNGHDRYCIGEWDQVPNCVRRVDSNVTGNDFDPQQTAHTNGLIWSRMLLQIFLTLKKQPTDRLILQSHFNVPDMPTFAQAADAIIAADWQLYQGEHLKELCEVFRSRAIYDVGRCPAPVNP